MFEWLLRNISPHIIHCFTKRLISIGFIPLTEKKKSSILLLYIFNSVIFTDRESLCIDLCLPIKLRFYIYLFQSIFVLCEILHQELVYVTLVLIKLGFRDSDYPSRANNLMISCLPLNLILYYGYFVLSFLYCRLSLKMSRSGQSETHWSMH